MCSIRTISVTIVQKEISHWFMPRLLLLTEVVSWVIKMIMGLSKDYTH